MMTFLFGLIIGLTLGLTGGGGSIFALPLLTYGLHVAPRDAISVSLAAVALTAAFGAAGALRTKLVEYRAGLIFAVGGMLAAPLGVGLAQRIADSTILTAFALLMLIVAVSMWRRASRAPQTAGVVRADFIPAVLSDKDPLCRLEPDHRLRLSGPCSVVLVLAGIVSGLLSGLFGVGGGFLIVPALTFVTQLEIHRAVATSLLVITLIGLTGVGAVLVEGRPLPWLLTGLFIAGGFGGMYLGQLVARRIAGPKLQQVFAVAMVLVAAFMIGSRPF